MESNTDSNDDLRSGYTTSIKKLFDNITESELLRNSQISRKDSDLELEDDKMQMAEYLECDNVRIYPAQMIFADAFDGKKYKQPMKIINCGTYPAFIRIFPPSSNAFKLKALQKGVQMASGMCITRVISHTFSSANTLPRATMTIYINGNAIVYSLSVYLSCSRLSVEPKILHFGEIDIGTASDQKSVFLVNKGHKSAHFVMDLGRHDLELIVLPMKGVVQPYSSTKIEIEILGCEEGSIIREIWIKTEPPLRLRITATFITPKFVILFPISNYHLTFIHFPQTYYGATNKKSIILKNYSSHPIVYSTTVEIKRDILNFDDAKKMDNNLKSFDITPQEGRLMKDAQFILVAHFTPKKLNGFNQNYRIAFVRVNRISFRDGYVKEKDMAGKTFPSKVDVDTYINMSEPSFHNQLVQNLMLRENSVRLVLYGEAAEACVHITPDAFQLSELCLKQVYFYSVCIKNVSSELPITFVYNKVAYIEIEPKEYTLNPNEDIDISVHITPTKVGVVDTIITFNLLYNNQNECQYKVGTATVKVYFETRANINKSKLLSQQPKFVTGITPLITNEVGYMTHNITFESVVQKPVQAIVDQHYRAFRKGNTDLIAFPNDRARSLRPWNRKTPCKTIFAQIPRYINKNDTYMLEDSELVCQKSKKILSSNYLKKKDNTGNILQQSTDYEITNRSPLLKSKRLTGGECPNISWESSKITYVPIALPPENLRQILIYPKYIALGQMAPYTACKECFFIENKNDFIIHITIEALNNSIVIKGAKRRWIPAKQIKSIEFECFSHGLGKYYVPVYLIVNDSHIFDATVFADVIPCTVRCTTINVVIRPKSNFAILEITNPVNTTVTFNWEVQDKNFNIIPSSGTIDPLRTLLCKMIFTPTLDPVLQTDVYLLSQNGAKQIIKVSCEFKKNLVECHTKEIVFENVPLNSTVFKELILRNFSDQPIIAFVSNPKPITGIKVTPSVALMHSRSDYFFRISALFKLAMNFSCELVVILQDGQKLSVKISGNVVLPEITLSPASIQFPKIPAGALQRRIFRIKNTCCSDIAVDFPLKRFKEFDVVNTETFIPFDKITLQPEEAVDIFLQFIPPEPIVYSLLIPYVLNDLVGPPVLNNSNSLNVKGYFRSSNAGILPDLNGFEGKLSFIKVRCAAGAKWLNFSSLNLMFQYNNSSCQNKFTIENVSNNVHDIIISLNDLTGPFRVEAQDQNMKLFLTDKKEPFALDFEVPVETTKRNSSYYFELEPREIVTFTFIFEPTEYGNFRVELPILVKEYNEICPYNFLTLTGVYPEPTMTCSQAYVFFPTVTTNYKITETICLKLLSHEKDCILTSIIDDNKFSVSIDMEKKLEDSMCEKYITISFFSSTPCRLATKIKFTCSCDVSYVLEVSVSTSNSRLVSYNCFGLSESEVLDTMEMWLFSQGFFCKYYYKIPDTISRYPFKFYKVEEGPKKDKKDNVKKSVNLPLVDLFINLIDKSITKYFSCNTQPETNDAFFQTSYCYGVYKNILKFLEAHEVFAQFALPELLLPYEYYVEVKQHITDSDYTYEETILSEQTFYDLSKQAWLDLLLKIYKTFVFDRILAFPPSTQDNQVYLNEFMKYFEENSQHFSESYTENEIKLLLWLEFHFENQKNKIDQSHQLSSRKIRSFLSNTEDYLPLATLVIAYCPYATEFFKDIYCITRDNAKKFHNAYILHSAFEKLNLPFLIKISNTFFHTDINILMALTYLYDVLPGYYPLEEITLNANIGETVTYKLGLKNPSNFPIAYTILFFHNDKGEFQADKNVVKLGPKGQDSLKIRYLAKNMTRTSAVIVLSGETSEYKCAKSKAYNLLGIPNNDYYTAEYSFKVDVFKFFKTKVQVSSPCGKNYTANTYIHFIEDSVVPDERTIIEVASLQSKNIPRELKLDPESCFDKAGTCNLNIQACPVACGKSENLLYFLNSDVGVFSVKIIIDGIMGTDMLEDITVKLPLNFNPADSCRCKYNSFNPLCPLIFFIDIPSRNYFLLEGLKLIFEYLTTTEEYLFWKQHLVFPRGLPLFRSYMENSFDPSTWHYKNMLQQTGVTYVPKLSQNCSASNVFTIEDVTSSKPQQMKIHWNSNAIPTEELLDLQADHGQEIRKYRLVFKEKYRIVVSLASID